MTTIGTCRAVESACTVGGDDAPLESLAELPVKVCTSVSGDLAAVCVLDTTSGLRRGKKPCLDKAVVCFGRDVTFVACDGESYETKLLSAS